MKNPNSTCNCQLMKTPVIENGTNTIQKTTTAITATSIYTVLSYHATFSYSSAKE